MNKSKAQKQIGLLKAQIEVMEAQIESIAHTLTVLEKELAGDGAPAGSSKKKKVEAKTNKFLANRRAKRKQSNKGN